MRIHSLVAAIGLLAPSLLAQPADAQVTAYRNDIGHSGYTGDTLTTPLSLLWRHTTSPVPGGPASPLYAGGTVFFGAGGHVYALRASDGKTLWQFPATEKSDATFKGTPALDGGFLYAGGDNDRLYKINAATGEQVWTIPLGGPVRGAPTVDGGLVYFGSADNHCYAAHADSGAIAWSFVTNGAVTTPPAVSESDVFFAAADNSIYCLSKTSGRKLWSLQFDSDPSIAPPVFADGTLYAAAGDTLFAYNAGTGAARWSTRLSGEITTSPTVGPGFVAAGTVDSTMYVLNRQGRVRWSESLKYPAQGAPLLAGSEFLVPCQHGVLYALQADTGRLAWEYIVPASTMKKEARAAYAEVTSSPALADGTLYLLGNDGTLSALRADALDALPPQVGTTVPQAGATVSGVSVYPSATVLDEGSGVNPQSVSLSLDGRPLSHVIYDAGRGQVRVDTSSPDAPTAAKLDDGVHQVTVKATDWRGNTVTQTWGFFVDNRYNRPTDTLTPATP